MSPSAVTQDMRETNRIFEEEVVGKGDFAALDRVYTKNARILPPGAEMVTGRENIKAFWHQAAAALRVKSVKLRTVDVEVAADTLYEIGRAELVTENNPPAGVKYIVVWKREDGAWKWHIDIWNPNA